MKNFDLNNYGVQEITEMEIRKTEGGSLIVLEFVAAFYIYEVLSNPRAHAAAFMNGWNSI